MKVNLIRKNSEKLEGYINIDPHPSTPDVVAGSHENLDSLVDNAECTELRAYDVIDFVPSGKLMLTIQHWKSKLALGGKLTIGGSDIKEIARGLTQCSLDEQKANELLYNVNDTLWDIKMSAGTLEIMMNVFKSLGLKIESATLRNYRYVVTGIRQ